jgi:PAS domain S-box-containing protein
MYLADLQGRLQWSTPSFLALDAKARGESQADWLALPAIAVELLRSGSTVERDLRVGAGAAARAFRARHVLVRGELGEPVAIGGLMQEQANARGAEDAGQLRERLDDVVRLTSDWIWETDARLDLTSVSHRIFEVLGVLPRAAVGRGLLSLSASQPPPMALMQAFTALRPFRDQPFEAATAEGETRTLMLSAVPIFGADGRHTGFRGAARDVTQLHQREASLKGAKEAAELADRAKSEFLANTSHELRTPLNAIIGFAEVLQMEIMGPLGNAQYRGYIDDIHSSAQHLLALISDVLEVSRIDAGKAVLLESSVSLPEVFAATVRMVAERAERSKVRVGTIIDKSVPAIRADETKVKQILTNLLSNAVKFTEAGGSVTLSARLERDGDLLIAVADTGIGIARGDLERVWEPFTQADGKHTRKYEGTGLGLPLSRGLAELHGGSLTLDSELGVGTTVTFRLPAARVIPG